MQQAAYVLDVHNKKIKFIYLLQISDDNLSAREEKLFVMRSFLCYCHVLRSALWLDIIYLFQMRINALSCINILLDSFDKMLILDSVLPFLTDISCQDSEVVVAVVSK